MEGDRHTQTWGQVRTPRTRADLCKDRMQPRPQVGDSAHRGAWPQEAAQMHAHSRRGLPYDSLKAANGLLPWKTKDVQ